MSSGNYMDGVVVETGIGAGMAYQRAAAPDDIGSEIVEDLVEAMTFQKLTCTPRMDVSQSVTMGSTHSVEPPVVRARRARTVASQSSRPSIMHPLSTLPSSSSASASTLNMATSSTGPLGQSTTHQQSQSLNPVHLPEVARVRGNSLLSATSEADPTQSPHRPRKHSQSQGSANIDSRRKRSYSMCESDEDDELASLSSTASYQSASKHQKLRDDTDDEQDFQSVFLPPDSIHWATSLSSNSITSSDSSASLLYPPTSVTSRMGPSKASSSSLFAFSASSGGITSSATATPSSSSRSSPRSSVSSPRSTSIAPSMPSVFKRAQSDCTVLHLRNCAKSARVTGEPRPQPGLSTTSQFCLDEPSHTGGNQMEVTTGDVVIYASETGLEELINMPTTSTATSATRPPAAPTSLSSSGRRSVSASSLPTTYRVLQIAPIAPQITFSSSISTFAPVVVKPIPLSSPPVRRQRSQDSRSPPPFSIHSPQTTQRSDTENYR